MPVYEVKDKSTIAPLFEGWHGTMIWSCLDDCMGKAYTDNLNNPQSAQIVTGPFCYYAGKVSEELIKNNLNYSFDIAPQNAQWAEAIENIYGSKVRPYTRYATKKENTFNIPKLQKIVSELKAPYKFKQIDNELYDQIADIPWAEDWCSNFENSRQFLEKGLGFLILEGEEIVAGASSFTFYKGGIEIQIDTREDKRRQGLGLACGAKMILECLDRNLYPSWDAHNKGSLALSEKLGYIFDKEYTAYEFI